MWPPTPVRGAKYIVPMCGQISRGTGHNCPSSLIQMAVERCLDVTSDLSVYETNMNLIYDELKALGFTVVKPDGTFYIFQSAGGRREGVLPEGAAI